MLVIHGMEMLFPFPIVILEVLLELKQQHAMLIQLNLINPELIKVLVLMLLHSLVHLIVHLQPAQLLHATGVLSAVIPFPLDRLMHA